MYISRLRRISESCGGQRKSEDTNKVFLLPSMTSALLERIV